MCAATGAAEEYKQRSPTQILASTFAPRQLAENLGRFDAAVGPQHHQVKDQVGAFGDDFAAVVVDGRDDRLDRFLADLFGDLGAALAELLGDVAGLGVAAAPAFDDREHALDGIGPRRFKFRHFLASL